MVETAQACLGLGSSLGDRERHLRAALQALGSASLRVLSVSPVYESPHLGLRPEDSARFPPHLNLAALIETTLSPEMLLAAVQAVETAGGRIRVEKWGPRTIDIDILAFDALVLQSERLTLPHPGLSVRAFAARPLTDLLPDFRLPDGTLLKERLEQEPMVSQPIRQAAQKLDY